MPAKDRWSIWLGVLAILLFCVIAFFAMRAEGPVHLEVRWTVPALLAPQKQVSFDALQEHPVVLEVMASGISEQNPAIETLVQLHCRNAETGEEGSVPLIVSAVALEPTAWRLTVNLAQAWFALPYPVDPGAVESKPAAIISQRLERSLYRLTPAELRHEFRATAEYMMVTAHHSYRLPTGDGRLECRFDVAVADETESRVLGFGLSQPLVVTFGRGLPVGSFERDHSLPRLDGWPLLVAERDLGAEVAPPPAAETAIRNELDELLALQEQRTDEELRVIRQWDDGSAVGPWIEITLDAIVAHDLNPVRASRALALVSAAMYDAVVAGSRVAWEYQRPAPCSIEPALRPIGSNCATFTFPSEHALVAAAASTVLRDLFPAERERLQVLMDEATTSRLWAGANYRSDLAAGLRLGEQAGQAAVARARSDGADDEWHGQVRSAPGKWAPTPPDFHKEPLEPLAPMWRPWHLASGSQFRPPPPPTATSARFAAEMTEVYQVARELTLEQQMVASSWEDKQGSFTPPGHWNLIALRLVCMEGMSTPDAARLFATLNTAQADAFIAAWDTKFAYWSPRPVTAIRDMLDPDWSPYIQTPPFPSYVSGHATTSGAAARVLAHFFPDKAVTIHQWAEEAAISRLYGGIHFASDNEVGLLLGGQVAGEALRAMTSVREQRRPGFLSSTGDVSPASVLSLRADASDRQ